MQRTSVTTARIGITAYAQSQLGDVVFVQLPEAGTEVTAGESFGEVESTKSVSDVYAPLTAKVVAVNADLEANPELVNTAPYGEAGSSTSRSVARASWMRPSARPWMPTVTALSPRTDGSRAATTASAYAGGEPAQVRS